MLSVLEEARIEILEGYRDEQVKSLKYYLKRIDQANRQLAKDIGYIARDKETVIKIEHMTVEEFRKSTYYGEGTVR